MRSTQRPATAGATDFPAPPASPALAPTCSVCLQPACARVHQTGGPWLAEAPERALPRGAASVLRYRGLPKAVAQTARRPGKTLKARARMSLAATA